MSKTYKDQRRWFARNYWHDVKWRREDGSPLPKDINEPTSFDLYTYPCGNTSANYWHNFSWRKLRRDVKHHIQKEDYDNIPRKPMNVDWIIY